MTALPPLVFAIWARYVARILAREKTWELRTRRPNVSAGDEILIYEARGRGRIVARARVGRILALPPAELWDELERLGGGQGVEREAYNKYLDGRATAVAIELLEVEVLDLPLPRGMRPPQGWARYKGRWPR